VTLRRIKTYTAQTGYVYQYYFVGKRTALPNAPESPAIEYIFDVTSDRKTVYAVSVFLQPEALTSWAACRGRALGDSEQYAAVKLRLMQAFDEIPDLINSGRRLLVSGENIIPLLESIGLE
jgi:hypothetical protein